MKILRKILWWLIYLLPAVLFFSYHPVISLGSDESMNFELSLPLIWLVIFDLGAFVLMLLLAGQARSQANKSHETHMVQKSLAEQAQIKSHGMPVEAKHPRVAKNKKQARSQRAWRVNLPGISDRRFFLLALFPLYATFSVLWSDNRLRGLLTAGVMWLVFFAVFAMLYILPLAGKPKRLRTHVLIVFFVASILVCKYCYAQSIMDVLGVGRENTLLCLGCTYKSFGFPHPSGFAIEPQFMGNLLLAPTLTALYMLVFRPRKFAKNMINEANYLENKAENVILRNKIKLPQVNWSKWQTIGLILLAGFLSTTLFFTFSRGAIYAYGVALIVMMIVALRKHQFKWSLITIPVVSFLLSLTLQGTFAAVGPTTETFVSGVTKSIHQLSLGIIDLRPKADVNKPVENSQEIVEKSRQDCGKLVENSAETVDNCDKTVKKVPETVEKAATVVDKAVDKYEEKSEQSAMKDQEDTIFEGYVAESTNIRLKLNQVALWTWLSAPNRLGLFSIGLDCHDFPGAGNCLISTKVTPSSILFGVGLGGAGTAMHAAFPDKVTSSKEIVQHQGFSLLLETGLMGVVLVILGLLVAFFPQLFSKKFLDGKSAGVGKGESTFWQHPVAPLLLSLVIAYLVTLNFFSGLPNALQIYLMPPLLYLIFAENRPAASTTTVKKQKS